MGEYNINTLESNLSYFLNNGGISEKEREFLLLISEYLQLTLHSDELRTRFQNDSRIRGLIKNIENEYISISNKKNKASTSDVPDRDMIKYLRSQSNQLMDLLKSISNYPEVNNDDILKLKEEIIDSSYLSLFLSNDRGLVFYNKALFDDGVDYDVVDRIYEAFSDTKYMENLQVALEVVSKNKAAQREIDLINELLSYEEIIRSNSELIFDTNRIRKEKARYSAFDDNMRSSLIHDIKFYERELADLSRNRLLAFRNNNEIADIQRALRAAQNKLKKIEDREKYFEDVCKRFNNNFISLLLTDLKRVINSEFIYTSEIDPNYKIDLKELVSRDSMDLFFEMYKNRKKELEKKIGVNSYLYSDLRNTDSRVTNLVDIDYNTAASLVRLYNADYNDDRIRPVFSMFVLKILSELNKKVDYSELSEDAALTIDESIDSLYIDYLKQFSMITGNEIGNNKLNK